eukprot:TRINITY_DN26119_c1_g1_i1.p2 TRINITY_DN26119_c1_g1~~TRINITY_DN26119_c1_g1_i1.p2  ORF type:complete len:135 (-),score=18.35 TRINITY_DN26119_c1_g1_i1:109-471(-)
MTNQMNSWEDANEILIDVVQILNAIWGLQNGAGGYIVSENRMENLLQIIGMKIVAFVQAQKKQQKCNCCWNLVERRMAFTKFTPIGRLHLNLLITGSGLVAGGGSRRQSLVGVAIFAQGS